jgi:hypothetical protein
MIEPLFECFPILIGDVWNFERGLLLDEGSNEEVLLIAMEKIRAVIIDRGRASVTHKYAQSSPDTAQYLGRKAERFCNARNLEQLVALNYFFSRDDLYEYNHDILISKEDKDFDYWFALKLRQYDLALKYLNEFLKHHLENTFSEQTSSFQDFLELLLLQYQDTLLSERVCLLTKKNYRSRQGKTT